MQTIAFYSCLRYTVVMEVIKPKDPNIMPDVNLFPRLSRLSGAVIHFFTQRHEIPNSGAEAVLEAHMDEEDRMVRYWGTMATPETPVPHSVYLN